MNCIRAIVARCAVAFAASAAIACFSTALASAQDGVGAVYVLTNQTANSVMVYDRAADGILTLSGAFPTGGAGLGTGGDPLGSQGSLVLDRTGRLLFAVNAGSNDVSVFLVGAHGFHLLDRKPTGGVMPVSVTVRDGLVYVLNAGGTPNIQGFLIDPFSCHLIHLAGSKRLVAGGTGSAPAEVAFPPDGDVLMATEKSTNQIDTWTVNDEGFAEGRVVTPSSGATPFGFTFDRQDFAIVTEAGPSALSSYDVDDDGRLDLLTGTLADGQKANCWVVVTKNHRYAYTTNTASGSISSYRISNDGSTP